MNTQIDNLGGWNGSKTEKENYSYKLMSVQVCNMYCLLLVVCIDDGGDPI